MSRKRLDRSITWAVAAALLGASATSLAAQRTVFRAVGSVPIEQQGTMTRPQVDSTHRYGNGRDVHLPIQPGRRSCTSTQLVSTVQVVVVSAAPLPVIAGNGVVLQSNLTPTPQAQAVVVSTVEQSGCLGRDANGQVFVIP